jgi:PKD domain
MNGVVRRVAPPVLLALVATGLAAAPAVAEPTWVAPAVTLAEGTSSRPPADSHVVVDAAGNATVAWVEQVGPQDDDHVLVSTHPLDGPWSPPLDISGSGDIYDAIDLVTNAHGTTVATWTRTVGSADVLEAATRPAGGGWSAPVTVADPALGAEAPQMVVDAAGNAVVTWLTDRRLYASAKPVGGTWSSADEVSDPAVHVGIGSYDLVVTPAGEATVVWTQSLTIDDRVIQAAVRPAGGAFGDPETLSSEDADAAEPQVAVNAAGMAAATWYEETATIETDVRAATRTPDGTWSPAEDVSAPGEHNDSPDVVVDSTGTSTVVWTRSEAGQPGHLLHYSSRPAGEPWSAPQDLTPPETGLSFNEVALAIDPSDRITAVYDVLAGGSVVTASTRAPGEPWGAGIPLSPSGDGFVSEAEVAMDDAGQATVIWLRSESPPGYVVETRTLDTQGPLATGLSLPAATVGAPVTLSWPAVDAWSPIASVAWSFSDGGTGSGSSVTRTFAAVGSYAVSVTATDAVGNATTLTGTVVISPPPPITPPTTPTTPATPLPKPTLSGVKLTRKTIHVVGSDDRPRATKLKLSLNVDATVVVKLKRTAKVNGKAVKAKQSLAMKSGQRAIRLTSKVGDRLLVAGTYRVTLRATNATGSSAVRTVKLAVVT